MMQSSKVKSSKLELTDAERELLLGNNFSLKLKENNSQGGSGAATPSGVNTGKRKRR